MIDLLCRYGDLLSTLLLNNTPFNRCITLHIYVDWSLPIENVVHCLGPVLPPLDDYLKVAVFFRRIVIVLELACEVLQCDDRI